MPTEPFQYRHNCGEAYIQRKDEAVVFSEGQWFLPLFRMARDQDTALIVRWCPFCGEHLQAPEEQVVSKPTGFLAVVKEEAVHAVESEDVQVQ